MLSQRKGRLSTITQVKVLSLEMMISHWARGLLSPKPASLHALNGECVSDVPGSEAMVGSRIVCIGTWESHIVPQEASNEPKRRRRKYGDMAVGLTHSRGVDGVMLIESPCSLEGVSSRTQRDE
ncbi:MAG: hypothetical protein JSU70_05245 [Phycisphaerales bacterium]|nr:MAG: hypothetical protein JSU70_05245 [Phycisphaerales bacterium]